MWSDQQHYVFSNLSNEVPAGVKLTSGDVAGHVKNIKAEQGKDIWLFGGAVLASSLIELSW